MQKKNKLNTPTIVVFDKEKQQHFLHKLFKHSTLPVYDFTYDFPMQ